MGWGIFRKYPRLFKKYPWVYSYGGVPGAVTISSVTSARGSMYGKESVVIIGTNFGASQGAGYVQINGVTQSITSWSDLSITISTIPSVPGAYVLKVQNNAASSATSTYTFTESIYERAIAALIYNLGKIKTEGGYNYTIKKVYDPPVGLSEMYDYPSVNIEEESETCSNTHVQTGGNEATLLNSFNIRLDCVLQSTENPRQDRNKFLQDIQKLIGNNWYIPDEQGDASAFNCFYSGSTSWGMHDSKALTGISVKLAIWYTQKLTDPAKAG